MQSFHTLTIFIFCGRVPQTDIVPEKWMVGRRNLQPRLFSVAMSVSFRECIDCHMLPVKQTTTTCGDLSQPRISAERSRSPWVREKYHDSIPSGEIVEEIVAAKSDSFANSSLFTLEKNFPKISSFRTSKGQVQLIAKPSGREHQNQQQHLPQVRHVRWVFFANFFHPPKKVVAQFNDRCIFGTFFWTSKHGKSLELPLSFLFPKKNALPFEGKWHEHFFSDRYFGLGPRRAPNSESSYKGPTWNWDWEIRFAFFPRTTWCKWWSNKRKPIKSRVFKGK